MKKLSLAKSLASVGLAAVCALGIVGCSEGTSGSEAPTYTGGVAATVNGVEIQEDTITQAIEEIRTQMNLTEEEAWGEWLAANDYTPESVREEILNSYIDQELIKQGTEELGIEADSAEVDQYVESMRSNYDSDDAWNTALEAVGLTEQEYRENIELSLKTTQLQSKVAEDVESPTDDAVLESAQAYVSSYDGAKKSSHILFDASEEALAQEVLEKVQSGELDFAVAAQSYSKDTGSASDGGNVGWDKLTSFVTEYTTALGELEKDEISGLVPSTYGIHIIKCTDVFEAPAELTSLDQLPEEFQEYIRSAVASNNQSQAYYTWLEDQRESADIVINDMPEGLPYDIDMTPYTTEEESADASTEGVTAVDADGNPVALDVDTEAGTTTDEGEQPVEEGVEEGAEQAEGEGAEAANEMENEAEGEQAADNGADADTASDAEGEQPTEEAAE